MIHERIGEFDYMPVFYVPVKFYPEFYPVGRCGIGEVGYFNPVSVKKPVVFWLFYVIKCKLSGLVFQYVKVL